MKALKARPELDRLYKKVTNGAPGMTFTAFEQFMRTYQKVPISHLLRAVVLTWNAVHSERS